MQLNQISTLEQAQVFRSLVPIRDVDGEDIFDLENGSDGRFAPANPDPISLGMLCDLTGISGVQFHSLSEQNGYLSAKMQYENGPVRASTTVRVHRARCNRLYCVVIGQLPDPVSVWLENQPASVT